MGNLRRHRLHVERVYLSDSFWVTRLPFPQDHTLKTTSVHKARYYKQKQWLEQNSSVIFDSLICNLCWKLKLCSTEDCHRTLWPEGWEDGRFGCLYLPFLISGSGSEEDWFTHGSQYDINIHNDKIFPVEHLISFFLTINDSNLKRQVHCASGTIKFYKRKIKET